MAEERLIDDDKDRKYKIRKNADGEDEIVLDDSPEIEEETEELDFEVPDFGVDDEEAAVMTPEQLAAREKAREEAEAKRLADLNAHITHAKELISAKKYGDCVFVLDEALELDKGLAEAYALKIVALTSDFTDLSRAEEGLEAADGLKTFMDGGARENYADLKSSAEKVRETLSKEVEEVNTRNDAARESRRVSFTKKRNVSAIWFAATGLPLVVFAVLAIYFSTVMHATKDGSNMVLFFVFLGIAVAFLIATLITAHKFWDSAKLLSLNEKNSSSKLGRECDEKNLQLKFIDRVISAFEEDKEQL